MSGARPPKNAATAVLGAVSILPACSGGDPAVAQDRPGDAGTNTDGWCDGSTCMALVSAGSGLGLDVGHSVVEDNQRVGYALRDGFIDDTQSGAQVVTKLDGQVPGLASDVLYATDTFAGFAMTPSGVFAFPAVLKGGSVVTTGTGVNDTIPNQSMRVANITLGPAINDEGNIAFAGIGFDTTNFTTKGGIWSGPPNDLSPVYVSGTPLPGSPGAIIDNPYNNTTIKLGTGRTVCFSASLAGAGVTPGTNDVGLFVGSSPTNVRLLARNGTQAPGMPSGTTFTTFSADRTVIFGPNRVAVHALTTAGPGLWMTNDAGALELVVKPGDTITTDQGDRVLSVDVIFQHGTGHDGLPSAGNGNDQLTLYNNGGYVYRMSVVP